MPLTQFWIVFNARTITPAILGLGTNTLDIQTIRTISNVSSLVNQNTRTIIISIGIDPCTECKSIQMKDIGIGNRNIVERLAREAVSTVGIAVTVGGRNNIADDSAVVAVAAVVVDIAIEGIVGHKIFLWCGIEHREVRHQSSVACYREGITCTSGNYRVVFCPVREDPTFVGCCGKRAVGAFCVDTSPAYRAALCRIGRYTNGVINLSFREVRHKGSVATNHKLIGGLG